MSTTLPPDSAQHSATPEERQSVLRTLKRPGWLKTEILGGLVVGLALIPEAIAFSVIAGVDPQVGLFASFTMAVTVAILGGRPAMISAATGAVALVIAPLVASHGIDYFIATVILAGVIQVILALVGRGELDAFHSAPGHGRIRQRPGHSHLHSPGARTHRRPVAGLPPVPARPHHRLRLPRFTSIVPAPLVAIVVLTVLVVTLRLGRAECRRQG